MSSTISNAKFLELVAAARAKKAASTSTINSNLTNLAKQVTEKKVVDVDLSKAGITSATLATPEGREAAVDIIKEIADTTSSSAASVVPAASVGKEMGVTRSIILNPKQQQFNDLVLTRADCVLIGAAGTGKTTCMRTVTRNLIDSKVLDKLTTSTKSLDVGSYGAAILSYTRKAVNNIRHAVVDELKGNTITIHKLLEFEPEFYEIQDPTTGNYRMTMRFVPTKNRFNPLPAQLTLLAFEESSMVGIDLYNLLQDAMPHAHQEIFLGDIQQLPPIFGPAVLGFKMLELPCIELTEIYRQAANSPIIDLAWKLLKGDANVFSSKTTKKHVFIPRLNKEVPRVVCPALEVLTKKNDDGEVIFQIWQKPLTTDYGLLTASKQFCEWADTGYYNPQDDIILLPFNKAFGTIELNKGISQYLGSKRNATVYEVIAGFNKHYLAVGDRVLYDKEDAFITDIQVNGKYTGKPASVPSVHLDRWGHYHQSLTQDEVSKQMLDDAAGMTQEAIDAFISSAADSSEDRVQAASHLVTIQFAYGSKEEVVLEAAGEINNLLGGYALTVHKAQGSEWQRVFLVMHHSFAVMNSRELLYTAVTRARKFLHIICETNTFEKGVKSQRIKGNTLQEKADAFKGKLKENESTVPAKSNPLSSKQVRHVDIQVSVQNTNMGDETIQLDTDIGKETKQETLVERLKRLQREAAAKKGTSS